jgi:two-component system response regulator QseB
MRGEDHRTASPTLLVVEDDEGIRGLLCEVLADEGFALTCVDSIAAARCAIDRGGYDLMTLDLVLGDDSGATLLAELTSHPNAPSTLLLSASPAARKLADTYQVEWLGKPFGLDRLIKSLRRAHAEGRRPTPPSEPAIKVARRLSIGS